MDKNPPDRSLDTAAQQRLDEYLDAVEQALVESGTSRTERRAVCDEIEAQAREMAFARAADQPTAQDMAAVLAELDDPEAYRASGEPADGSSTAGSTTGDSKIHPFALSAFIIPFVVVALIFVPFPRGETQSFIWWAVVSFLCIVLAGWAIRDIRRRPDRFRGAGLAVFGMLGVPMMVFSVFAYLYLERFLRTIYIEGGEIFGQRECDAVERWTAWEPLHGALLVALLLAFNAAIYWLVYRRATAGKTEPRPSGSGTIRRP